MHFAFFITIPLISAISCWFVLWISVRLLFNKLLPNIQRAHANQLSQLTVKGVISFLEKEGSITDSKNIERILPTLESHIDYFLRKKLTDQMPMIAMFIGDRTINQLKSIFMEELRLLFPVVVKDYLFNDESFSDIEQKLSVKITSYPIKKIRGLIINKYKKEWIHIQMFAFLFGTATGLIQLCLFSIIK